MPRVSVDIDLSYIPMVSSIELQKALLDAIERFKISIENELKNVKVTPILGKKRRSLLIEDDSETDFKVDLNTSSCGSLGPITEMTLQQRVYKLVPSTPKNLKIKLLPKSQIIAGKLSACHKRQLPRDSFDMSTILNHNDIPENITYYFVYEILSSTSYLRWYLIPPIHKRGYIEENFKTTFDGTI